MFSAILQFYIVLLYENNDCAICLQYMWIGKMENPLGTSLMLGFFIRMGLMLYGLWQDSTMRVQYTDVDYLVFTDAAMLVSKVWRLCFFRS